MAETERVDKDDLETAIELGDSICKELGICCAEKGKIMHLVYGKLRELKAREAAAKLAREEGFPGVAEMLEKGGKESA